MLFIRDEFFLMFLLTFKNFYATVQKHGSFVSTSQHKESYEVSWQGRDN